MSQISLKINVLANFLGNFGGSLLSFIFIPIYIKLLGNESFGLIGFYITLAGVFSILDFGIGATVSREMPKFKLSDDGKKHTIVFLKSFERISYFIAIFIAIVVFAMSHFLANYWLNQNTLSYELIRNSVILMGLIISVRWPNAIYTAALNGLEKQVLVNLLSFLSSLLSAVGVIFILKYISASIISYFAWQLAVVFFFTLIGRLVIWKNLKFRDFKGYYDRKSLLQVKRFALGIGLTALLSAFFTQMDKVLLSKMLDLETFGYYTIASAIASMLFKFIYPISQAITPRMVYLIHSGQISELVVFYQKSAQVIATVIIPIGIGFAFFSKQAIYLWSQNIDLTEQVYPIATILLLGTTLNGLINVPYALQVAFGYTRLILMQNIIAVILLVPLMFVLTSLYGTKGAASVWLILNIGYVTVSQYFLHKRYLQGQMNYWLTNSVLLPITIALIIFGLCYLVINKETNNFILYISITTAGFMAVFFCGLAMKYTRQMMFDYLNKYRERG